MPDENRQALYVHVRKLEAEQLLLPQARMDERGKYRTVPVAQIGIAVWKVVNHFQQPYGVLLGELWQYLPFELGHFHALCGVGLQVAAVAAPAKEHVKRMVEDDEGVRRPSPDGPAVQEKLPHVRGAYLLQPLNTEVLAVEVYYLAVALDGFLRVAADEK